MKLFLFLLLILAACAPATEQVKIGAIISLTGWGTYWGEPNLKGLELAQADIKEQLGMDIELIVEDHKSDAKEAATAAQKLISVDNVDAVITEFSGPSVAASPIVLAAKKLFLYDGFVPQPAENNPYALKFYLDPYTECNKLAEIAHARGKTNPAGVIASSDFSTPCKKGVTEVFPDATFYDYAIPDTDFRTILTKVKARGADVIISLGYEQNFIAMFTQKKELGITVPIYCGSKADCATESVPEEDDTVVFDFSVRPEFAAKFKARYPDATETDLQAAASSYDELMIAAHAFKACPDKNIDCLVDAAKHAPYTTAIRSTGISENRILQVQTANFERVNGEWKLLE